jgi:ubiquinone/menaquinone biosynthesis C-methylase UbiE
MKPIKHPILLPYLREIRGNDVLNVGGRKGEFAELFEGRNYKNLDINPKAEPDIVGSAYAIPLPDNSLDAVISIYLLEHLAEPHRFVEEIKRVLRPGGQVLLMAPFIHPFHGGNNAETYCPDYYRFTHEGLAYLFRDFKEVRIDNDGGFGTSLGVFFRQPWLRILDRLYPGKSKHAYILMAQKS